MGKTQRLMLLGYDSEEISKKLSKAEWRNQETHVHFLEIVLKKKCVKEIEET